MITTFALAEESREHLRESSVEGLQNLREILARTDTDGNLPLSNRTDRLLEVIYRSRWRNSISQAIRLLVDSSDANDRKVGWQLAQGSGAQMSLTGSDIGKIVDDPDDSVRIAAIRAVTVIDINCLSECIQRVLDSPKIKKSCKTVAVLQLGGVPSVSDRVRLWLIAAEDKELRGVCVSTFPLLDSSEEVISIITEYLDDTSEVNVGVSADFGRTAELRTLVCQSLSSVRANKEMVIAALVKHCGMPPNMKDLDFFLSAMLTVHELDPDSSRSEYTIMDWYKTLPVARSVILQELKSKFLSSPEFESMVISGIHEMSIDQKCHACEWLSCRTSAKSVDATKGLLKDSHSGIRLAAAVALTKKNPMFDLATGRDELLNFAASNSEDFSIGFQTLNDAVCSLALAGQSDNDAILWLERQSTNVGLKSICKEALELLSVESKLASERDIPWKSAR